eukprot:6964935-Prymnesium_polylepis.1
MRFGRWLVTSITVCEPSGGAERGGPLDCTLLSGRFSCVRTAHVGRRCFDLLDSSRGQPPTHKRFLSPPCVPLRLGKSKERAPAD